MPAEAKGLRGLFRFPPPSYNSRDSSAGALAYAGCAALNAKGCTKIRGVKFFNQVTISVDGRTLYLGGSKDVGVFDLSG